MVMRDCRLDADNWIVALVAKYGCRVTKLQSPKDGHRTLVCSVQLTNDAGKLRQVDWHLPDGPQDFVNEIESTCCQMAVPA